MHRQEVGVQRIREVFLEVGHRCEVHADQPRGGNGCSGPSAEITVQGCRHSVWMRCNKSTEISLQGAAQIVIEVRLESDVDDMAEARAGRGVGYGHGRILADTGQTQGRRAEKAESPRRNGGKNE